jgi:hypothetical protein
MVLFAPIPSATMRMTTTVKPGFLMLRRKA